MISRRAFQVSAAAGALALVGGVVLFRLFRRWEARGAEAQPVAGECSPTTLKDDTAKWKPIERQSATPTMFPLHPVEEQRYLVDAAGQAFLIVGDSAWSLLTQLTTEDAELYLSDRQAKGFNTLLINLLEHKFADGAPRNVYGDGPFKQDGDFSTPNDRYFDHAERILRDAAQKGFLVLLAPAYIGASGGDEGWYREMEACGPEKLRDYGRYVGKRFKHFKNIIWVNVGDYNPPNKTLSQAVAEGIREILPDSVHTAHNAPEMHGLGYWSAGEIPIAIDTLYTYAPVAAEALLLAANRKTPYFLIETMYENEKEGTPLRTRIQAWQAVLSGAAGQLFGNNPIWHFNASAAKPQPMQWKAALNSPGTLGIVHLRNFLLSLPWFTLEPDSDGMLLVGGALRGHFQAVAARSRDGKFGIIYLPSPRLFAIDLKQFAGDHVTVRWFDPADGQFLNADPKHLPASGRQEFNVPGCSRDGDWVLLLSAA
ncbi:apiosidase-like domain-containing protein [Bradyrhizobium australiense]|uniref:DUF4038 domain-containing protein n=1 Tax=Bradyrhizobium australiense TaxID=2721161 RepID=A0A7Y4LYN6_9BRAD|nr:DUF4038 domain-containing protein [Bradyrhizobium australiense]NOJ43708.1 DUF4038 domain-containing protein [Bradyrhizobium australiense]